LVDGLPTVVPPLDADCACDVAIIGSGITGALVADCMVREGLSVVVLDRRDLGLGSTVASTALLQYDLDVPLHKLAKQIGWRTAARAFTLGAEAIGWLERSATRAGCVFHKRHSVYYARDAAKAEELGAEHAARTKAGFDVSMLDRDDLADGWGLRAHAAILSTIAAETDPYALTHALLRGAITRGALVHDRTGVVELRATKRGVTLRTDRGPIVRARYVVNAMGYESAKHLPPRLVELSSTYALVSEPTAPPAGRWKDRCLLWEYADPYLYCRWVGDRVLVGGEDVAFVDERRRDRLIARKARTLHRKCAAILPELAIEPAFAWTGTFATTKDGLGYIGALPASPRVLYALGFGGNGITCSAIASRLLTDRVMGRKNPDLAMFRFER
jgi:glycine/D-amino acid oxidase-like deaminating enzyme